MSASNGQVMLRLDAVRKAYGARVAVDGLTLEVHSGEVFGLLGPNGAGKTTTVSMAVGLLRPDGGTIEVGVGGSPIDARIRSQIGVAPQSLAVYDELTGEENLRFFGRLQGLRGATLQQRAAWALDFVGLGDRKHDRTKTYSGGMKRRLNMAAAFVHDPAVVLFDEPTVGVDPQSRNHIFENIEKLRDAGKAVIYTTHYMEEASRLCDRVGIINHGKLLALDTVPRLIETHGGERLLFARTDTGDVEVKSDDPLAALNALNASRPVRSFAVKEPNLENVFLHLTGRHLRDE